MRRSTAAANPVAAWLHCGKRLASFLRLNDAFHNKTYFFKLCELY
jgi:hypothetical protein